MRPGKLPENTWKRAVLTELSEPGVMGYPGIEKRMQYSVMHCGLGLKELAVSSAESLDGTFTGFEKHAVQTAYNYVVTSGAEPSGAFLSFILPEGLSEQEFRKLTAGAFEKCGSLGLQVYDVSAESLPSAERPVISVRVSGMFMETGEKDFFDVQRTSEGKSSSGAHFQSLMPGMEIIMTKWAGLEAGSIIASKYGEELKKRFSESFAERFGDFEKLLSIAAEGEVVRHVTGPAGGAGSSSPGTVMYALTEGGIFRALWELGEGYGAGLDVDVRKIPVRQEIIEACEFLGLDPYEIRSGGSMLIAAVPAEADRILKGLEDAGIPASVIGRITDKKAKRILNGDEIRYLDRPAEDGLLRIL